MQREQVGNVQHCDYLSYLREGVRRWEQGRDRQTDRETERKRERQREVEERVEVQGLSGKSPAIVNITRTVCSTWM